MKTVSEIAAMLKPRVGDMVTLKPQTVCAVHEDSFRVGTTWWSFHAIASIEPRPLQVGDRVWITTDCKQPGDGYRVEFASDRVVLSYNGSLLARTYTPADLTRVEDKP